MEAIKTINKESVNDMASGNIKEEQIIKRDGIALIMDWLRMVLSIINSSFEILRRHRNYCLGFTS